MDSRVYTIHTTDGKPIKIAIENKNGEPISEEQDSYFSEICKAATFTGEPIYAIINIDRGDLVSKDTKSQD